MIAKIGRSSNLYGALVYNHNKVEQEKGKILFMNNMIETPNGKYTVHQLTSSFESYLAANKNTEKHTVHISLNPDPGDTVSDTDLVKMAEEYMMEMGYGKQPYIVFKHTDIERTHMHIVSVCVDENGRKISDTFERRHSMEVCRKLEKSYGLLPAKEQKNSKKDMIFSPVDYHTGNVKHQLTSVIRKISEGYSFKTFGEYNALLSLFNIAAEKIEGELHGKPQKGLVYFVLDQNKKRIGYPFKASRIGRYFGLAALELRFLKSKELPLNHSYKSELKTVIDNALKSGSNENNFVQNLKSKDIDTVIRRNESGRLYGITFIDHRSRTVWNGSNLGKEYSANVFNNLWKDRQTLKKISELKLPGSTPFPGNQLLCDQLHPLFGFLKGDDSDDLCREESLYLFPGLLPAVLGEEYEEEIFARQMKKYKRKRKP
ncbi:conjugal transfer protein MobB [Chryseobacterium gleum]|uniref:conjugal transfer protein MobB n=1 Tax=Chryseobacterium gleum TaxID=250 RepID=UPI001E470C21|nr:conjugal transfer protein MobB [Chryseobacterium gleum]MCD9616083.1 relaxase/mobilization nuclease domain-containing protein [Chryseobacterium gleum]